MPNSSELRSRARQTLGDGVFSSIWLCALLVGVIATVINGLAASTVVLSLFVVGPMSVGVAGYFVRLKRGKVKPDDFGAAFDGFTSGLGDNIVLGLLTAIYTFLWSLLFVIPGIVKSYSYAMAPYIKADHPEYTASQCINESRNMMQGHKMQLFKLHLSFIGWIILSGCCCFLIQFWVTPYMNTATAHFYEALKGDSVAFFDNSSDGSDMSGSTPSEADMKNAEEKFNREFGN